MHTLSVPHTHTAHTNAYTHTHNVIETGRDSLNLEEMVIYFNESDQLSDFYLWLCKESQKKIEKLNLFITDQKTTASKKTFLKMTAKSQLLSQNFLRNYLDPVHIN